ncbi:energy transducer TonB [Ignatzschineria sp. LJL83]
MLKISNILILLFVLWGHWEIFHWKISPFSHANPNEPVKIADTVLEVSMINLSNIQSNIAEPPVITKQPAVIAVDSLTANQVKEEPVKEDPPKEEVSESIIKPQDSVIPKPADVSKTVSASNNGAQNNQNPQNRNINGNRRNANNASRNANNNASQNTREGAQKSSQFMPPSHQGIELGNKKPKYPELSLRRKEEGKVTLLAHVLPSGKAEYVRIYKSSGYSRLDDSALKATQKYQYQPAIKDGQKVSYDYIFTVTFKIQ